MLVGVLYFPRFDISLNDLHIKRPGSCFMSVTDALVIPASDLADSPMPGLKIIFILFFSYYFAILTSKKKKKLQNEAVTKAVKYYIAGFV